jgi:hypothetical protein
MQEDEDVGRIQGAVPAAVSRCAELFLRDLADAAITAARKRHARTIMPVHVKEGLRSDNIYDFLADIANSIPDTVASATATTTTTGGDDDDEEEDEEEEEKVVP